MSDRSPCIYPKICQRRSPGCQSRCEIGRAYFKRQAEKNEAAKEERRKDKAFDKYKTERAYETKRKAGVE